MTTSPRRADETQHRAFPRLYPIIDLDLCRLRARSPEALAAAFVAGGARLLQVRQKSAGSGAFLTTCRRVVAACGVAGVRVIVNDRADLAVLAGAHGVHVGQEDLAPAHVRRIIGAGPLLGLSTHTPEQVEAAQTEDVDYLAVGPVFRTATKETGYTPRGLDLVGEAAAHGKPVVAIGGITLARAAEVIAAGASAVAVIGDLLSAEDPSARVREYLDALG